MVELAQEFSKEGILLETGTNEVEFIEFYLGKISYGINVAKVQRVIALSGVHVTKVPQAPEAVIGIIHIQDKPIPLIDLKKALKLNIKKEEVNKERQLVLVAKFNRITTSYLIDGVSKIHRTTWGEFEPMSDTLSDNEAGYTTGTIKIKDRIVLVLDLERLILDFMPETAQESMLSAQPNKKIGRENVHIIYAEDSKMVRRILLKTLNANGYTSVTVFEHGLAAHEYLEELKQKAKKEGKELRDYVDLIITDIEMPKMDGLTLCKKVKSTTGGEDIPSVVVYSSLINEEMLKKCKSVGADGQISKPHGNEIIQVIDNLCLKS